MGLEVAWRALVVERHESVVGFIDDAVETRVEYEDDDDDQPSRDEVGE